MGLKTGFTLAEVLITLGVIGVVSAITLPVLQTNVQERVRREQVRTVKYKLTLATDKMKTLDLIGPYSSTESFVKELKNHFKIAKICDNNNLEFCWPTSKINTPDGAVNVSSLTTGESIKALALGTKSTKTLGIITGDGTPMIIAYSPSCLQLENTRTYPWSTQDNKPVTNATTNCISAIFDINGSKGPNRIGTDVRTLNSLFGSKQYAVTSITKAECEKLKNKLGIKACSYENDYWAGAVKKCADINMHLPDPQTLASIAGAKYGRTDIGVNTSILVNGYTDSGNCVDYFKAHGPSRLTEGNVICISEDSVKSAPDSSVASIIGRFWSSSEVSPLAPSNAKSASSAVCGAQTAVTAATSRFA